MTQQTDPHAAQIPCPSCGYNLRGQKIGDACPECGARIAQYPVEHEGSSGKAVASLVLGIVSIVSCSMYGLPSVICGPLAMMYAKQARIAVMENRAPRSSLSMAKGGRVCGLIGTILGGITLLCMLVYFIFFVGLFGLAIWTGGSNPAPGPTP